jgi:type II secretory pathway pseudopilin PulG
VRTCRKCSSTIEPGTECPTCGARLQDPVSWHRPLLKFLGCFGLLAVVAALLIPGLSSSMRASNDRNASASLKTLASAEADFRSNDRDGNGVRDFWTGDVAGLYCIAAATGRPGSREPIKEIEVSVAGADSDPLSPPGDLYPVSIRTYAEPRPKAGYWYWALREDASEMPPARYRQDTGGKPSAGPFYNKNRFGFLCYPDRRDSGKYVFIINEGNTVFQKSARSFVSPGPDSPPGPVTQSVFMDWPGNALLKMEWSPLKY